MKEKITEWNILDHLTDAVKIAGFLEAALEDAVAENDYAFFLSAIDDAMRARGINAMAQKMGVNRQSLYKSFDKGSKPNFDTVFKAIDSLGLRVRFLPKRAGSSRRQAAT